MVQTTPTADRPVVTDEIPPPTPLSTSTMVLSVSVAQLVGTFVEAISFGERSTPFLRLTP